MNIFGKIFFTSAPIVMFLCGLFALLRVKKYRNITNQVFWGILVLLVVVTGGLLALYLSLEY